MACILQRPRTNLECDSLPMRRVDGFDNGHGILELSSPSEQLAVKGDTLW